MRELRDLPRCMGDSLVVVDVDVVMCSKHVKSLSLKHVITKSISEIGEQEAPLFV